MRFTPQTEKELFQSLVLPKGIYNYEVVSAEDALSKSGNEMIKLGLKVWDNQGKVHIIYDYLLEAMPFKLRHFAEYAGIIDKYNLGNFEAADCLHRGGQLELVVQEAKENFPMKNSVKDYVKTDKSVKVAPEINTAEFDDQIPF